MVCLARARRNASLAVRVLRRTFYSSFAFACSNGARASITVRACAITNGGLSGSRMSGGGGDGDARALQFTRELQRVLEGRMTGNGVRASIVVRAGAVAELLGA